MVCALYIFCCVVVFVAIRERRGGVVERREPYGRSIKPVFTFPPYTRLMLAFLFVSLGMQITQGNLALYTTHSLKRGEHMAFAIIVLLCSAIAFVPVLQVLSSRFGKKTVFATCNLVSAPDPFPRLHMLSLRIYGTENVELRLAALGSSISTNTNQELGCKLNQ